MKNLVRILVCVTLATFAVAKAVTPAKKPSPAAKPASKKPEGKADARTLVSDSKKALAAMIKDARADKGLDPKTAKNKPFWKSTHQIANNLKTAEKGLAAKNKDFFKGIDGAHQAAEEMKVSWQLTDSKNKGVIENGRKLSVSLGLLRKDYSKEAARKKKGGELTAQEKAQFDKIKAQQKDLLAKIDKLKTKATKDKSLEKGLNEIEKQANEIAKAPVTLAAYLAALRLIDEQTGLIRGYQYYVDKEWRGDYQALITFANWYDTWYYEWADPIAYDWVYVDRPVEIYYNVDVTDSLTDTDIADQDTYAENEAFDMTDAEEDEVAAEEDTGADVEADDEDSMDEGGNDEEADMADDEGGDDDMSDDDGGDDGGDDSGGDDGGGDEG
jgi:hypothetical protein